MLTFNFSLLKLYREQNEEDEDDDGDDDALNPWAQVSGLWCIMRKECIIRKEHWWSQSLTWGVWEGV